MVRKLGFRAERESPTLNGPALTFDGNKSVVGFRPKIITELGGFWRPFPIVSAFQFDNRQLYPTVGQVIEVCPPIDQ
ncbi:MAG TPA: hypothetical protein DCF63_02400 [Planctomycetaceae bacterium]|nr:hypothetical protein [Planctomycetaceae bacterium]